MVTSTVENYVKQIYLKEQDLGGSGLVPMGELAQALQVVPGTATSMIKTLADAGLVDYEPRMGVRLTSSGEKLALHILRRHRLVELFLVQICGMDWSEIHEEAEQLEHVISERLLERIDTMLGHPTVDPHGDPIPSAQGVLEERALRALSVVRAGERFRVARVLDQGEAFLQFVQSRGLQPGVEGIVTARDEQAGTLTLQLVGGEPMTLGLSTTLKLEVEAP